jgi:L-ornithine N5-oxygenase
MNTSTDYEVVGVGLGPANLALCVALEDAHDRMQRLFLERQESFAWHPGMQMEGSSMQTPFLEDLVTRHDPTSPFTFLNYLKEKGRLTDFADLRDFYPTRLEFNDYFAWAAEKIKRWVRYGASVTAISPVRRAGKGVEFLYVNFRNDRTGREETIRARNVVLGLGYTPIAPAYPPDGRVFHSANFLPALEQQFTQPEAPYSFLVAGAGQSAAEITLHLLRQFPNAHVSVASRGFVFRAKDPNPFVSAFYTGSAADRFFDLPEDSRRLLLASLDDSNYAAADNEILQELAKFVYHEKVSGRNRLSLRSFCEVGDVDSSQSRVRADCWSELHHRRTSIEVDGVCFATGFDDAGLKQALTQVDEYLKRTSLGDYLVNREYRIEAGPSFRAGIYVQGHARTAHGCTEGTISDLPHRAQRIRESLAHHRYERRATTFLDQPTLVASAGS